MTQQAFLRNVWNAIALQLPPHQRSHSLMTTATTSLSLKNLPNQVQDVKLLATGGYNSVVLVKLNEPLEVPEPKGTSSTRIDQFIVRLPCEDALLPNQITNDVAFKRYVAEKLPHIPIPKVYLYQATSQAATSFTVEEYIDCPPLTSTWMSLTDTEKHSLAEKLAAITVDLAEIQFDQIGGLDPTDYSLSPTVEGCKLFKGRGKFHRNECYHIGPYKSTKEYILSCYDREIYYYTHAENDIDPDHFLDVTREKFIEDLKKKRTELESVTIADEPFVLVHGDFHGRNILAKGDQIAAIIDWDFAGSYPLSETLTSGSFQVLDLTSEEEYEEVIKWQNEIDGHIREEVAKRAWPQSRIDLLFGPADDELAVARMEMIPCFYY
ncbi:kinase-like domain-containing protein [Nemania sp. FL0031]|nr:kinase-like domain-containing protein [Nemania sp. FL0031]